MFFKNIEGYPGLVKGFPIDSKALSSRRGRILSLSQVFPSLEMDVGRTGRVPFY
jgi:hypothetical protein